MTNRWAQGRSGGTMALTRPPSPGRFLRVVTLWGVVALSWLVSGAHSDAPAPLATVASSEMTDSLVADEAFRPSDAAPETAHQVTCIARVTLVAPAIRSTGRWWRLPERTRCLGIAPATVPSSRAPPPPRCT